MESKYKIEELVEIFTKHSKQYDELANKEDPDFFSLADALMCICKEIVKLKENVES